jgi:hypothetical protein
MAKTKKKRRSKHRGTQGGRVDTRPARRPRNRAEARAQAKSRRSGGSKRKPTRQDRALTPPTWRGSLAKGGLAAVLFFALFALVFRRPLGPSAMIAVFMLAFYVPMSYFVDDFMFKRRIRQDLRKKEQDQAP